MALAIDGDAHGALPGGDEDRGFEGVQVRSDPVPALAREDENLQVEPLIEGDLDRVLRPGMEVSHEFLAEEGAVEPELELGVGGHLAKLHIEIPEEG